MRFSVVIVGAVALAGMTTVASARDYLSIAGSSTVLPFATIVAEQLGNNPSFKTPVVESGGSSVGKKGVCEGIGTEFIDIGNASSRMKVKELEYCDANGVDVTEIKVGYDGIVVANSKEGTPLVISKADLGMALTAMVPAWPGYRRRDLQAWCRTVQEIERHQSALPDVEIGGKAKVCRAMRTDGAYISWRAGQSDCAEASGRPNRLWHLWLLLPRPEQRRPAGRHRRHQPDF